MLTTRDSLDLIHNVVPEGTVERPSDVKEDPEYVSTGEFLDVPDEPIHGVFTPSPGDKTRGQSIRDLNLTLPILRQVLT